MKRMRKGAESSPLVTVSRWAEQIDDPYLYRWLWRLCKFVPVLLSLTFWLERLIRRIHGEKALKNHHASPEPYEPGVSVVILNWNGKELLDECLSAVRRAQEGFCGASEVWVVDNASTDGSVDHIRGKYPWVKVLARKRNDGFADGNNDGVKQCSYDKVLLLNTDIILQPDTLVRLAGHFRDPQVFAVAPRVVYPGGRLNEGHSWGEFRQGRLLFYNERSGQEESIRHVATTLYPIGACALIDRRGYQDMGGLDTLYRPFYWEDDDLGYRALKRGYKVLYDPSLTVVHLNAASSKKLPPSYIRLVRERNMILFGWKNLTDPPYLKEYLRTLPALLDTTRQRGDGILLVAFLAACLRLPKVLLRRVREANRIRLSDRQILHMTQNARRLSNGRSRRPKILLLTPFLPYPVTNGGAVRINSLTRHLAANFDFHLLSFVEQASDRSYASFLTPPFKEVETVQRIPVPVTDMLSAEVPDSYSHYVSDVMRESMERAIEKIRPDIVQIEFPWMAGYAPSLRSVPSVLIEHDVGNLLPGRGFLRESRGLEGYRFSMQAMNWTVRHLPWFDRVVTVTPEDEQRLRCLFPDLNLKTVETGVDLDEFSYCYDGGRGPTLIYLGHYRHYPNEDAAVWFLEEILPRIREEVPSVRLLLVGSHPTRRICAWKGKAGIHVTGTVENVKPYFEQASLFIAPIRKGAGIKGKLLEAMAMGTPVVATSCANAGIGGRDRVELRIADKADAFAETVVELLQSRDQRMDLSRNGRKWVEDRFDWRILAQKMRGVYRDLAAG